MAPTHYGYPTPIEIPGVEAKSYQNVPANNPQLSGLPLTVLSRVVASVPPLQDLFWNNAHFGTLRKLKVLESYSTRYDPTVAPAAAATTTGPSLFSNNEKQDKTFYSSADYVAAYKDEKTTPTAVAEYLLSIIKEPPHNLAFIEVKPDLALKAAQESTERYKNGTPLGPLDGVPIAVKDEVDIHGYTKSLGSAKVFDKGEGKTSWSVKKLEEAGAIIIGKTNMHELGTDTTNNNPVKGTPRNPYNKGFYTGGSSGGSAYAVGSGLVPIAVGADGGGSIRLPSTYCGAYGIKPSHGRVSGRPSVSVSPSNGVLGPIACSLPDLALAYRIMAIPDQLDTSSAAFPNPLPPLSPISSNESKIIGIYRPWFDDCSSVTSKLCNRAVEYLTSTAGYQLVEIDSIPYLNEARLAHALSIVTEIATFVNGDTSQLNAANKILLSVGSRTPAIDYATAQKVRSMMMSHFAFLFQKYPGMILVTPSAPHPGVKINERDLSVGVSDTNTSLASMRYVFLANFIGTPSLAAGVGYDEESGIPVSLMGMAEWGCEEELFGWGVHVSEMLSGDGGRKRGETWVDVLGSVSAGVA